MEQVILLEMVIISLLSALLYGLNYMRNEILEIIDELDGNLATALQGTIAEVAKNLEPPNPLHGLIAQWMQVQQEGPIPKAIEILDRTDSGQFKPKV